MKKLLFLPLLLGLLPLSALKAAPKNTLADTANVRISAPGERAAFLNQLMREKLSLDEKTAAKVEAINEKYEQRLQDETLASQSAVGGGRGRSKAPSFIERLSADRSKEMLKALSGKQKSEYEKNAWHFHQTLKKQMQQNYDERMKVAKEEEARRKAERAKAVADSIAAAKKPAKTAKDAKNAKNAKDAKPAKDAKGKKGAPAKKGSAKPAPKKKKK